RSTPRSRGHGRRTPRIASRTPRPSPLGRTARCRGPRSPRAAPRLRGSASQSESSARRMRGSGLNLVAPEIKRKGGPRDAALPTAHLDSSLSDRRRRPDAHDRVVEDVHGADERDAHSARYDSALLVVPDLVRDDVDIPGARGDDPDPRLEAEVRGRHAHVQDAVARNRPRRIVKRDPIEGLDGADRPAEVNRVPDDVDPVRGERPYPDALDRARPDL